MKPKSGLQKKVSSIFDSVQFPKNVSNKQDSPNKEGKSPGDDKSGAGEINASKQQSLNNSSLPGQQKTAFDSQKAYTWLKNIHLQTLENVKKIKSNNEAKYKTINLEKIKQNCILPVTGVLSIIILLVAISWMGLFSKGDMAASSVDPGQAASAQGYQARVFWEAPPKVPNEFRDITRMGDVRRYEGKLIVKGILYSKDNASAIIGKGIVHVGDIVMGAKIVDIGVDFVEFEMNNKRWRQKVEQ
ncbi:MAG: hypothetical protein FVQ80_08960 [Planctomycetes bacterium]|nr:hypothetical protein [Planctomycetota bacterium]